VGKVAGLPPRLDKPAVPHPLKQTQYLICPRFLDTLPTYA
jgi:hypothetical protein